jgi:hypothetical protein
MATYSFELALPKNQIPPTGSGWIIKFQIMNARLQKSLIPPTGVGGWFTSGQNRAAFEESTNSRWWDLKGAP